MFPARASRPLRTKPDYDRCMERMEAWFEQQIIDRPPVRLITPQAWDPAVRLAAGRSWPDLKSRWFDAEYQIEVFRASLQGQQFRAETFPVFWPNLGPEVYPALFGGDLVYEESTSYYVPSVHSWSDADRLRLDVHNEYFLKLEEMTRLALEVCGDEFVVGYSDLHGGVDCAAAWRNPEQFCVDLIDSPTEARALIDKATAEFVGVFNHFDRLLKEHGQPSVTWLGIPSYGRLHIPSCDFASLISTRHFVEFCLPSTLQEVPHMTHNIFHVDGKGVAKNLDYILDIPEIQAIQYVQGAGDDLPIMQWIPDLKKIRNAGKSLVIDIQLHELEPFMQEMRPEGIYLCLVVEPELQPEVIRKVERWRS